MSDDPVNPLLDHLTEDARSFSTIASSWAKAAHDLPAVMMKELVSAFWRGQFERDGKSSIFALLQPDSPHFFERRPGNYATRADGIVKVGADLRSYVTAERKKVQIFRRAVAEVLCWKEWDGTDDGLLGLAIMPFEKWSEDIQELHYSQWRMRRDNFAKWYLSTALTAEARMGQFWPDQARRSVPPKLVDSRRWDSAVPGRKWWTLPAGLMWAMTRNVDLTERVHKDREAFRGLALNVAVYLAEAKVYDGILPTYFGDVMQAWLAIRDLIADEKIMAEGQLIERRGLQAAIDLSHTNGPIPSGEAGRLILLDNWSGFTETVLGPDETYRFHNRQGRYWKQVRLSAKECFVAFPPPQSPEELGHLKGRGLTKAETAPRQPRRGHFLKVEKATNLAYPDGIPEELNPGEIIKTIEPHLEKLCGKGVPIPCGRTLRDHIKKIPRRKPST